MEISDGEGSKNKKMFQNANSEMLQNVPSGFRFLPTKLELSLYLRAKLTNSRFNCIMINDENVYNYYPWELTQKYNSASENAWYFFSPRDRKYKRGKRPTRTAGTGYWKASGKAEIIAKNGCEIRTLVYYKGKNPGEKTNWIMHEYVYEKCQISVNKQSNSMKLDDCVLYKVHYNNRGSNKAKINETEQVKSRRIHKSTKKEQFEEGKRSGSQAQSQDQNQSALENEVVQQKSSVEQVPVGVEVHKSVDKGKGVFVQDKSLLNSTQYALPNYPPSVAFPFVAPLKTFDPNPFNYIGHPYNTSQYELGQCSKNAPPTYHDLPKINNLPDNVLDEAIWGEQHFMDESNSDLDFLSSYLFNPDEYMIDCPSIEEIGNHPDMGLISYVQSLEASILQDLEASLLQDECSNAASNAEN